MLSVGANVRQRASEHPDLGEQGESQPQIVVLVQPLVLIEASHALEKLSSDHDGRHGDA